MTETTETYVGEQIRQELRRQGRKNGFLVQFIKSKGITMSDSYFSCKLYGQRMQFTTPEIEAINEALGTQFSLS